jgi:uncharacterized protein
MTVMPLPGWPFDDSPYHDGEIAMQERAGVRSRAERLGRHGIRDFMPDQHRELFTKLPYLLVGSVDAAGQPHASILVGRPGFMRSPDRSWPISPSGRRSGCLASSSTRAGATA